MNYVNNELRLKILINNDLFYDLCKKAEAGYPNEAGGLLVGRYSTDRKSVIVTKALTPTQETTSPSSYTRKTEGMEPIWQKLYEEGLQYIGEWHSHPNGNPKYSTEDLNAMRGLYSDEGVTISKPLLLILGVKDGGYIKNSAYIYNHKNNELIKFKQMVDLKGLFTDLQEEMSVSLKADRRHIAHTGSKGDATENRWINFFRTYLPNKYKVDKAMVIDHNGEVSDQIDIVIYDALFTPFIFNQDEFKYIPAEAVYAVFEVKQDIKSNIEYAGKKIMSVRKLERTSTKMINSGRRLEPRNLTKIIGGILTTSCTQDQENIKSSIMKQKGLAAIDCGCCIDSFAFHSKFRNEGVINGPEQEDAIKFYKENDYEEVKFCDKDKSLLIFFLQLFNDLKEIGSVPAIDINAYLSSVGATIDDDIIE